jgi:hypothetical protein
MGDEILRDNIRRAWSLTKFQVLVSQESVEASRLCLAASQDKISTSLQAIKRSDTLIRALCSDFRMAEGETAAR